MIAKLLLSEPFQSVKEEVIRWSTLPLSSRDWTEHGLLTVNKIVGLRSWYDKEEGELVLSGNSKVRIKQQAIHHIECFFYLVSISATNDFLLAHLGRCNCLGM